MWKNLRWISFLFHSSVMGQVSKNEEKLRNDCCMQALTWCQHLIWLNIPLVDKQWLQKRYSLAHAKWSSELMISLLDRNLKLQNLPFFFLRIVLLYFFFVSYLNSSITYMGDFCYSECFLVFYYPPLLATFPCFHLLSFNSFIARGTNNF